MEDSGFVEEVQFKSVKEARLYEKLNTGEVRCLLCHRKCLIRQNQYGFCGTRKNFEGKLYTIVYGDISSISVNPIEKKPFFHFHPGSRALTVGTWSCNFTCAWCQNFHLSKNKPDPRQATYIPPRELVKKALSTRCHGISFSFNEPTLMFEYALEVFPLAHEKGLYNTYVSNGYMTEQALRALAEVGLDAIKFDVKGDSKVVERYCGADIRHVWENIKLARELGLHVELVNLVIPDLNDGEDILREVAEHAIKFAGDYTPLHYTRFFPSYKMIDRGPTEVQTLERAYKIAREVGLKYVYLGNVPGHVYENTYCHSCGALLIKRLGFKISKFDVDNRRCPRCGVEVPIIS
ncbi:MAG: AmmeMemoRadiSam system radical SAM enzyme [Nitrososphaeria archaeon]